MGRAKHIHTVDDARRMARRRLPWMVFDYIDGAAGDGRAEAAARRAIEDIRLRPRVLRNVESRDLSTKVLGQTCALPFGISPMGMCNLARPGTDLALARLCAERGMIHGASTVASTSLEDIQKAARGNAWFQLYFSGDGSNIAPLVKRAKSAGYKTLVLTVDVAEVGKRPRELRRGFTMPFKIGPRQFIDFALHPVWSLSTLAAGRPELANFGGENGTFDRTETRARADMDTLKQLRDSWDGNLVIKGVLDAEDAVALKSAGVDAIQVSSHGGRQLVSVPYPIHALSAIRAAVGAEFPLFFDSGIRSGEDIVTAYAMGANHVFLGRPFLFAAAAAGAAGLEKLTDALSAEVSTTLALLGHRSMSEISAASLSGARAQ